MSKMMFDIYVGPTLQANLASIAYEFVKAPSPRAYPDRRRYIL